MTIKLTIDDRMFEAHEGQTGLNNFPLSAPSSARSGGERGGYDARLPLDLLNDAHVLLHLDVNQRAGFGMRQRAGALDDDVVNMLSHPKCRVKAWVRSRVWQSS